MTKKTLLLVVAWCLLTASAFAQVVTTRVIINQPANPSGSGWSYIQKVWFPNGQNSPLAIGPSGYREFHGVSGNPTTQLWLTDSNGWGSIHTLVLNGTYDTIEVYVQGPVVSPISYRPFIYYGWKNGVKTYTSPVTYLYHTHVPF